MNYSPPGSSDHGILQARILEWGAMSLLRGIFPIEGTNLCLLCLLHWQAGSLPLAPPGNPMIKLANLYGIKAASCNPEATPRFEGRPPQTPSRRTLPPEGRDFHSKLRNKPREPTQDFPRRAAAILVLTDS